MKRIFMLLLLVSLAIGAFAQIDISAGVEAGGGVNSLAVKFEVDSDNYMEMSQLNTILGFGAFVDATYVRLSLDYGMALSRPAMMKVVVDGDADSESVDLPDDYSLSLLNIGLLGKYPISLGTITLWPALGILYSMVLSMDADGDGEADDLDDLDLNDFYISFGGGADISITSSLYVTISALFSWNLTPIDLKDTDLIPDEVSYTGYRIVGKVGVGYKF